MSLVGKFFLGSAKLRDLDFVDGVMPVEAIHQLFDLIVVFGPLFLQLSNVVVQCGVNSGGLLCVDRWGVGAFDSLCF